MISRDNFLKFRHYNLHHMRYLIETSSEHAGTIGAVLSKLQKSGKITIIERGDPVETIKADILKVKRAVEALQKSGINRDIMISYIRSKGVSLSTIDTVLHHQEEFFNKLGIKV